MKTKYAFFSTVCFFLVFTSFSQVNSYFQNNPEWYIITDSYSGSDCSGYRDAHNYYINGDTILNALVYKKVYKKGILSRWSLNCMLIDPTPYSNKEPSFCLRSADKKIFLMNKNTTQEELMYDFNLAVGDTLPQTYTYHPGNHTYDMYVAAIDSIHTPNGYLKRFTLSKGNDTLYEGIGSTGGLDEPIFRLFLSGQHELICYGLNRKSYVHPTTNACDFTLSVSSLETDSNVSAFPNPFSDKVTLHFNSEMKNATLTIFNLQGAVVRTVQFSGKSLTLEREELKCGIYYYKVETGKGNYLSGKLVVLN